MTATTTRVALRTEGLSKDFWGFRAVNSVDLQVLEGGVHALVGPNGAGKTTLFNLLTGFLKPSAGKITVFDRDTTGLQPEEIAHLGVARSFQITSLFENLTPREHVELALQGRTKEGYRFFIVMEDRLASSGFEGIGIITGSVFVAVVLLFRRGVWGTLRHAIVSRRQR